MIRPPARSQGPIVGAMMVIALSGIGAHAGMNFERTSIDLRNDAGETKLTGVFPFKNDGDRALTILAVRSCCGCTTTTLEKRVYQAGEAGEIRVSYSPGSETGERRKTVEVVSDDPKLARVTLVLRATIEPVFKIGSRIASWRKGEAIKPREIEIEVRRRQPLEFTSVLCSSDKVEANLTPIEIGRKYKLTVVPKTTAGAMKALITIGGPEVDSPKLRVLALIR